MTAQAKRLCLIVALFGITCFAKAQVKTSTTPKLTLAYELNEPATGITTTAQGRVFVLYPHLDGKPGVRIAELTGKSSSHPYPDEAWNHWESGDDPSKRFIGVNSLRIGPDGFLWIVDTGTRGFGSKVIEGGAKLVAIDLAKNVVKRVYPLQDAISAESFVDDVRFHGTLAYLTDAGMPGIIILDLASGRTRRVLDHNPATTARRSLYASGSILRSNGKEVRIHADQMEVSPDGRWFYFQPASGPMSRIETRYLDDPAQTPSELSTHVTAWADTPSTGGTAMDADGNLYLSDVNTRSILKYTPSGVRSVLLYDDRLDWVDAMWIDHDDYLWMPTAQLDQLALFKDNVSHVKLPVTIYKMKIGSKPQY